MTNQHQMRKLDAVKIILLYFISSRDSRLCVEWRGIGLCDQPSIYGHGATVMFGPKPVTIHAFSMRSAVICANMSRSICCTCCKNFQAERSGHTSKPNPFMHDRYWSMVDLQSLAGSAALEKSMHSSRFAFSSLQTQQG